MDRSSYEGLDRPTTPPSSHVATGQYQRSIIEHQSCSSEGGATAGELPLGLCGRSQDRCPRL